MKKHVFLMIVLLSATVVSWAAASPVNRRISSVSLYSADEKVKITKEELPEAVKKSLAGDGYKGWEVTNAFMYKESQTYEVEAKKGTEVKTFKFDKEGKVVK